MSGSNRIILNGYAVRFGRSINTKAAELGPASLSSRRGDQVIQHITVVYKFRLDVKCSSSFEDLVSWNDSNFTFENQLTSVRLYKNYEALYYGLLRESRKLLVNNRGVIFTA